MAYITRAAVKTYLGATQTGDDALLDSLILAAQAFIEGPDGAQRVYEAAADTTRYFDAISDVSGRTLYLDRDCCQITTVANGDGGAIPSSEYVTEPRNSTPFYAITLKAASAYVWQWSNSPENSIAITGRWAYSVTAPERVQQWMRELVAYLYRRKDSSGDADRPLLTGDGITILPSALPKGLMYQMMVERKKT